MFKKVISITLSYILLYPSCFGAMITPDGKTNTTVTVTGNVTDIHTTTVSGQTGFNSFTTFDVYGNQTANMYLPDGTQNLVNLVRDKASNIDGILNSFKDGKVGGNIFFLNPNGIAIGASGVVNVGALTLVTPTKEFMDSVISADKNISSQVTKAILAGDMPINPLGLISIKGKIKAFGGVGLFSTQVAHGGSIETAFNIADIVNLDGKNTANDILVQNGKVIIIAKNIKLEDNAVINAGTGFAAADITLKAQDVTTKNTGSNTSSIDIGDSALIEGKNISLEAIAKNKQSFDEESFVSKIGDIVVEELGNTALFGGIVISDVQAGIRIGKNAVLKATDNVNIKATALSDTGLRALGSGIAVAYGKADISSYIDVKEGAVINAGKDVNLISKAEGMLDISSMAISSSATPVPADASVSIGIMDVSNTINLAAGTTINADNIEIDATTDKEMRVTSYAGAFDDGVAAAAITYSKGTVNNNVYTDGDLFAGGDIAVNSVINSKGNKSSATASDGTSIFMAIPAAVMNWAVNSFSGWLQGKKIQTNQQSNVKVGLSAAVSYSDQTNNAIARIGSDANVKAGGDIGLSANVKDAVIRQSVSASVDSSEGKHEKQSAIAGSVGLAYYNDEAAAYVAGGAMVDSKGKIDIASAVSIPFDINWHKIEGVSDILEKINSNGGLQNGFFTTWAKSDLTTNSEGGQGKIGLAGAVNISEFNTKSNAYIGAGAKINQDADYKSGNQGLNINSDVFISTLNMAGIWGIKLSGMSAKNALGGSYQQAFYNATSTAAIHDGAVVNTNDLTLKSKITQRNISIAEAGGKAETFGFVGAFDWLKSNTSSTAFVGQDAQVSVEGIGAKGEAVSITATDDIGLYNIAGGVVKGENVGIGASVAISDIERKTNVYIGSLVGKPNINMFPTGFFKTDKLLKLDALNTGDIYSYSLAGSIISDSKEPSSGGTSAPAGGGKFGVGISGDVSYNNITGGANAYLNGANFYGAQDLLLTALNNSYMNTVAGAVSINTSSKSSVGIAGAASTNFITDNTSAFINKSTVTLSDTAFFEDEFLKTGGGKILLDAKNNSDIITVAASGSVSNPSAKGGNLAGSVTVNEVKNNVSAYIKDSSVKSSATNQTGAAGVQETLKNAVLLSANDSSTITSVAGSLAVAGTVGIGASIGVNNINNTVAAYAENSQIETKKDIKLDSQNISSITNVEASVGAAKDGMAAATSIAVNEIGNTTKSYINGGRTHSKEGSLNVAAKDASYITAIAGEVAGSQKAAVGVATAVNTINNKVYAYGNNANIDTAQNVDFAADLASTLKTAAAGGVAGGVAVTGSVAVNNISNETNAYLRDSTLLAQGTAAFRANNANEINFYGGTISGGGLGIGGTVIVNNIADKAHSSIINSIVNAYGKTSLNYNDATISGLLVSSNVEDDVNTWVFNLAGAGNFALAASVNVSNIDNESTAEITGSSINQTSKQGMLSGQNVKVAATNKVDVEVYGGSIAVGGSTGIGAVADTLLIDNKTKALVKDSIVSVKGDLDVDTDTLERYNAILISGGGAATTGIAGNAVTVLLNNKNNASIIGSTIAVAGNTTVAAKDTVEIGQKDGEDFAVAVGAASGAGMVGIGGAVLVSNIKNHTQSNITDSIVNTGRTLKVNANASQDIVSYIPTAGIGGQVAGVAASVGVNTIDAVTEASIDETQTGTTIINGDSSKATWQQDVEVNASSKARIQNTIATVAYGGVGIGAGVGISTINGKTISGIGAGTQVKAKRDIKINAINDRTVNDIALAAAGGSYGAINGSILITNIGSDLDDDSRTATDGVQDTLNSHLSQNGKITTKDLGRDGYLDSAVQQMQGSVSDVNDVFTTSVLDKGTSAFIGANAQVSAGNNLEVLAKDTVKTDLLAGGMGMGYYLSFGNSIAIVNNSTTTKAYIGDNSQVQASNRADIKAESEIKKSNILATVGQGSLWVALGAAVAKVNANNNTLSYIGDSAKISGSGNFNLLANAQSNIHTQTVGVAASGIVAAGASVSLIDKGGNTAAYTGANIVGNDITSLHISATNDSTIFSEAQAGTGGIVAGSGAMADALVADKVSAIIGKNALINAFGNVGAVTRGEADVKANTYGVNIGALAVGVSLANAKIKLDNIAQIEEQGNINAGTIIVAAEQKKATAVADASAATGALVGGSGAVSNTEIYGNVLANISGKNTLNAAGGLAITSKANTAQAAQATYFGGAVISAGVNEAYANSAVNVTTILNDGLTASADRIEISANGADKLFASAISGSGGLVSASAATAGTKNNSVSAVEVGVVDEKNTELFLNTNITGREVILKAQNATNQDSFVDARNGGLVHAGGAMANNTANMHVDIDLKDRGAGTTNIIATYFKAEALNNFTKNQVSGPNIYSGSGGALDVPISESITNINNYTNIKFGNNNNIKTVADAAGKSTFLVNAFNNIKAYDKVVLKSGGLLVVPVVKSAVNNENNYANITVNAANLSTDGDMVFNTKADVDLAAGADLNIYGGIAVAAGKSLATTVVNNKITLNSGANLMTDGDVYFALSQPKMETNNLFDNTGRASIKVSGITNVWNKTALAFDANSQAKGDIYINNSVDINAGSAIHSGKNININGAKALMSSTGLLDLTSALGDLAASDKATSVVTQEQTKIRADGDLLAGVNNMVNITIDADRNIKVNGTSADYAITQEQLSKNILDEIDRLKLLKQQYSVSEIASAAYQSDINRLEAQLKAIGQVNENGLVTEVPVDFITFGNIRANVGDIVMNADDITGTGKLSATGYAEIKVHNASDLFLRFNDLTIDSKATGTILYNGVYVTDAKTIANTNKNDKNITFSDSNIHHGTTTTGAPIIEIISDYSFNNRGPNMELRGDIFNDNGDIKISSSGSIEAKGNLRGQSIKMTAAEAIVQAYAKDSFVHIGGGPSQLWDDEAQKSESAENNRVIADAAARSGANSMIGNNIFLSASYLDINGLIQSGIKDLTLNVGDNFALAYNGRSFTIDQAKADYLARISNHEANVSELYAIKDSGTIQAFFNVLENRIELKDAKVSGGNLEIFGHILNTGGGAGQLSVLDGYGRIDLNNNSVYDLFVNSLDANTKVEGVIKITDTAKRDNTGGLFETIYKRIGDNLVTVNSNTRDINGQANNVASSIAGARESSYNPLTGQRYYWNTGKEKVEETTYIKDQNSFWGMDFLVPDASYQNMGTIESPERPLYEGEFVKTGQDTSNEYTYNFEDKQVVMLDENGKPVVDSNGKPVPYKTYDKRWSTTTGWWIFSTKTNHHEVRYQEGYKEINTHSIKADYPIKISFDGYDKGILDINNAKSNVIINGIINNASGDVNITAGAGSINSNSADSYIKAQNINLNAFNGIGGANALNIDLAGGTLNAQAHKGDINLATLRGNDLVFQNISTGNGNVNIKANASIYGANASAVVKGNKVAFESLLGTLGKDNAPVNIQAQSISATVQGDINLKQASGDLGVNAIDSKAGDVTLEVGGTIYDDNKNEIVDQRSKTELLGSWNDLDLLQEDEAGWTQDQLSYRIDASSLDNKVNTQYMVEDPNIKGKNVKVTATGAIGQDSGSESFNLAGFKDLSEDKKLLIASAERDNIIFSEDGQTLTVLKREDVDIHADSISLNANGFIYLGAEQDININTINAGADQNITIMGAGAIYNVQQGTAANITGNNLLLEAADGPIGTLDRALKVALTGKLNARAEGGIYLASAGNLAIDYLFGKGLVDIKTESALTDARADNLVNIRGYGINIEAASVGTQSDALGTVLEQEGDIINSLNLKTTGNANIANTEAKKLYIGDINAGGNLQISDDGGDIFNASSKSLVQAVGDISLNSQSNIATAGDSLNVVAGGLLSAQAQGNVYLNSLGATTQLGEVTAGQNIDIYSTLADIALNGAVIAQAGTLKVDSFGSIYAATPNAYIQGSQLMLNAQNGAIGTATTAVNVKGKAMGESWISAAAAGDIYLEGFENNLKISTISTLNGDLQISSTQSVQGLDLGGQIPNLQANNIRLHSTDGMVGAADNLLVVGVHKEGGKVNVLGARGIYLKQLEHTFNADYIKNTKTGDVFIDVPLNHVNIGEIQKQNAFNINLENNMHQGNVNLLQKDIKNILVDNISSKLVLNNINNSVQILKPQFPHVSMEGDATRIN